MELDALHLIKYLLYGAIVIPTVFGNGLILFCVYKFKFLRSSMHILIANLAISDLLVGAVLTPANLILGILDLQKHKYICLGMLSIFVACLGSSCANLMLISFERYMSVMFPLKVSILRKQKMILMILIGWVVSISSALPPMFGWNNYHGNETLQCFDRNIWTTEYMKWINGQFVAFIILNVLCYAIVVRVAIKKARKRSARANVLQHAKGIKDLHQVVTMVIVLGIFALCWLPYVVMFFVVQVWDSNQNDYIRRICLIPGLMNSALNWVIYGYRNIECRKAFQTAVKRLLCMGNRKRALGNQTISGSLTHSTELS